MQSPSLSQANGSGRPLADFEPRASSTLAADVGAEEALEAALAGTSFVRDRAAQPNGAMLATAATSADARADARVTLTL